MTETMMKLITKKYVTKAQGDYYSGITMTMINRKAAYELKGNFLDDLRNNAFCRTSGEDAVEHIDNFLKIIDLLDLPNYDDLVDGKLKEEYFKQKAIYEGSWGDATQGVMNFCTWLKRCFENIYKLNYELLVKLEEYWWKMNDHECSPITNWRNLINETYANTNIDANYNPYLDVSRTFNNHAGRNDEEDI
uniref:Uncharacterized protein n=1 Tax=Tanacetum cinerariifolium TaxID=118510 RepID=A0A6L2L7V1_TANCI|nr:hypothetical protein [Tanacetum cinerariifolium]